MEIFGPDIDKFLFMSVAIPIWVIVIQYIKEKGKNFATKEDIYFITKKIESAKFGYSEKLISSEAFFERKMKAYDEISSILHEIESHCFRINQESEHAVPYDELPQKSNFQRAMGLRETSIRHDLFISKNMKEKLHNLSQQVFMVGKMEMVGEANPDLVDKKFYDSVSSEIRLIVQALQDEFFATHSE